jgi:hypothetical protein
MKKLRKKSTNLATEFSNDLANVLSGRKKPRRKFGGLEWKKNWHLPGGGSVDVAAVDEHGQPAVLIEAELRREDPASNVVKIWKWAHDSHFMGRCLFVHSFTKTYRGPKQRALARARFAAARMKREFPRIEYREVRLGYKPRGRVGAGRRTHQARNLAFSVIRLWNAFQKNS